MVTRTSRPLGAGASRSLSEDAAGTHSPRSLSEDAAGTHSSRSLSEDAAGDRDETHAYRIAAAVSDPEVPVLTIEDLGVLRAVEVHGDRVLVDITPTYSGCPAMDSIRDDVILSLTAAGFAEVEVRFVLSPAWTTDWMSDAGKQKLEAYGIAPPSGRAAVSSGPIRLAISVRCPRCGSLDTREASRFGSTSCKSLFECRACLEPFDHFKVH